MSALFTRLLSALLVVIGLQQAPQVAAQEAAGFSKEQLEQLVAPIALYPDSLLTQVLMASTYPLELVEAQRWQSKNSKLTGAQLDAALKEQAWDPSVKSLVAVPDVLNRMSENLDWTQDLGDAFLAQRSEVMDTVQRMRQKAKEAGNLKSTEQQVVTQQPDQIIVIEQANPQVVYVPSYSPTVVYGGWSYPSYYYPPMYYPPPPGYGLMAFGVGVAVGAAFWGDCDWGWGHGDVDIDVNRYNEFNRNTSIDSDRLRVDQRGGQGNRGNWQHDPGHRKGVGYRDQGTAQKYGARGDMNRVTRDQARGFSQPRASTGQAGAGNRAQVGGGSRTQPGASAGTRDRAQAANTGARTPSTSRPSTADRSHSSAGSSRNSAYSGSRSPSFDRSASSRGSMSRGTQSFGGSRSMRSGGGGARRR
jgi:hypothetical protein